MDEVRERLLGTWQLVSWYNEREDGTKLYPLGPEASGYICYAPDGFLFVHLSAAGRALYSVNDPFGGSSEEDSAAMKSFISYAGRYECLSDRVIHRVTQASCPNWVGSEQVRFHRFLGARLELSASNAVFQGERVTARVLWERPDL
jgi:hypothetical protein